MLGGKKKNVFKTSFCSKPALLCYMCTDIDSSPSLHFPNPVVLEVQSQKKKKKKFYRNETLMILEAKNCFVQQQQKQEAHIAHEACSCVAFDESLMMSRTDDAPPMSGRVPALVNNLKRNPAARML